MRHPTQPLETLIKTSMPLKDSIHFTAPDKRTVVLYDTSALIDYRPALRRGLPSIAGVQHLVVGASVDELAGNHSLRDDVNRNCTVLPDCEVNKEFMIDIGEIGERTEKHQNYLKMLGCMENGTLIPRTQDQIDLYAQAARELERDGYAVSDFNLLRLIKRRWQLSDGDVYVMTAATQLSDDDITPEVDRVILIAKDSHIKQMFRLLQNDEDYRESVRKITFKDDYRIIR